MGSGQELCRYDYVSSCRYKQDRVGVLDSGATDQMTYVFDQLVESKIQEEKSKITLPNGHTSEISSIGKVQLSKDLIL